MAGTNTRKDIVKRLSVVYFATLLFGLLIIARIIYIQIVEHDKWIHANELTQKEMLIEPDRGDICAADGRILATSVPYYEVRMDMRCPEVSNHMFNQKIDSLSLCLSRLFGDKPASEYKRQMVSARKKGDRYFLVHRKVDYIQLKKLKTFPIFRLGQFKGGVIYKQENRRLMPFVNLATRTIGYEGKGGVKVGIEGSYDKELSGEKGVCLVQRIAGGYWMPISDENEVEPVDGHDVITTIDINYQDVAHSALLKQLQKHGAKYGTAILMEVETGDIKAIVNLKEDENGIYTESYNYAIGERTEPGSTFKLASLMAGFEDGYFDLTDEVQTGNGKMKVYDIEVRDTKEEGHGKISVQEVFEVSSNVGVVKLITKYYKDNPERFINRLKQMSLTEPLDLDIKGERPPYIKTTKDKLWSGVSLAQMAYGYEVEQTPLDILTFYNAVANNGKMMKPRFVKAIADHGQVIKEYDTEVINPSICSRSTIKKAHKMLEGVVEKGTAMNLKNPVYKIAGKTGTAQLANKKYGYKSKQGVMYQASFCGYFPADEPKYSCIVVVNAPSSSVYYGNLVAGPVFKEIADKVYSTNFDLHKDNEEDEATTDEKSLIPISKNGFYSEIAYVMNQLDIPVKKKNIKSEWVTTSKKDNAVELNNRMIPKNQVPNVLGMGAKDAVFILENLGLNVTMVGKGAVSQQSITPGSFFNTGDHIVIRLS